MGPPGSGKGTQAVRVADALGVDWVSSGDLFRQHQQDDTELGRLARSYMERGAYVPDDVTINMMTDWMKAPERSNGFVLDGFPRTVAQAEALDKELADTGGLDKVLYINVPESELVKRISGRRVCRSCQAPDHVDSMASRDSATCQRCGGPLYQRDDDKPEIAKNRIRVFADRTEPLVEHYQRKGKLVEVSGEGSIEEVGAALVAVVAGAQVAS